MIDMERKIVVIYDTKDILTRIKSLINNYGIKYLLKLKKNKVVNQNANSETCGIFICMTLKDWK
jgi:hypothetical protein